VYRHQLRFVLRFGVRGQFTELIHKLNVGETARGWATPRVWQAITGLVNEIVIEHDYDSVGAFGIERTAFHRDPARRPDAEPWEVIAELGPAGQVYGVRALRFQSGNRGRLQSAPSGNRACPAALRTCDPKRAMCRCSSAS
jgi:hypothetical protein